MNLSQAKPTRKHLNLNKLGDVGGFQIHWLATLAKTDSSSYFGITESDILLSILPLVSGSKINDNYPWDRFK